MGVGAGEAGDLSGTLDEDAGSDGGGGLAPGGGGELRMRQGGDLEVEIDAVASWTRMTSPVARAMPVRTAAPLPRLVGCETIRSCPAAAASRRRIEPVASVDPSSITMISPGKSCRATRTREMTWMMVAPSLKAGTIA